MALALLAALPGWAHADSSTRLLALAVDNRLTLMIGKYEGGHWVQNTDFYTPPEPGAPFSLYGSSGKAAEVTVTDLRRAVPDATFAGWKADLSPWDKRAGPVALALSSPSTPPDISMESVPLDNADARDLLARYLRRKGLRVDHPVITQILKVPLHGRNPQALLIVALSDSSVLLAPTEAAMYAVALLCWGDPGKETILPLASQTSFKIKGRTLEAHERLYGTRDDLRIITALDINGDGLEEIVLYLAKDDAIQVDVFAFDGRRAKKVLSAYKPNYN